MPRSVLRRRSHHPSRPDSPKAAPREQNAFCSSPKGCRKAEKCGDSRSRTFRPGGNAGVRRKGQRVRESSTERTHNARRYATLPGRPPRRGGRVQARPRAAWRCERRHNRQRLIHRVAAARSGPISSGSSEWPGPPGHSLLERVLIGRAWREKCRRIFRVQARGGKRSDGVKVALQLSQSRSEGSRTFFTSNLFNVTNYILVF